MHRWIAALALLAVATPALAQQPRPQPNRVPTTWGDVEQPLSALLNDGWRIVAMTGPGFTLEKRGKFMLCQLFPASGSRTETTSECHTLN